MSLRGKPLAVLREHWQSIGHTMSFDEAVKFYGPRPWNWLNIGYELRNYTAKFSVILHDHEGRVYDTRGQSMRIGSLVDLDYQIPISITRASNAGDRDPVEHPFSGDRLELSARNHAHGLDIEFSFGHATVLDNLTPLVGRPAQRRASGSVSVRIDDKTVIGNHDRDFAYLRKSGKKAPKRLK